MALPCALRVCHRKSSVVTMADACRAGAPACRALPTPCCLEGEVPPVTGEDAGAQGHTAVGFSLGPHPQRLASGQCAEHPPCAAWVDSHRACLRVVCGVTYVHVTCNSVILPRWE